eukprot:gb/GECH01000373.1/.p1 GENE.gb/GECH01000373.1/~~gb/GECH01000373.1/.p1  ORF type:complete len:175 (+),score=39.32 gb/GECH01000373.1/:1-525(+)
MRSSLDNSNAKSVSYTDIIKKYEMRPRMDGTYFSEGDAVEDQNEDYQPCKQIFLLLPKGTYSRFQQLKQDQYWHHYIGGPLTVVKVQKDKEGNCKFKKMLFGRNIMENHKFCLHMKKGTIVAAYPNNETKFAVYGCTLVPATDPQSLELVSEEQLLKLVPEAENEMVALTQPTK